MLKRMISFVLALVLCLSCLPAVPLQVMAEDSTTPVMVPEEGSEPAETELATEATVPVTPTRKVVGIEVCALPDKCEYIQNKESLDPTGGTLWVNYDDGSQEIVKMSAADSLSGFDNTVPGNHTIQVDYLGYSAYFDIVVVAEAKPLDIYFNGWNVKSTYLQGEPLDLAGGELRVRYSDGSQKTVPVTDPGVQVSGYDPSALGQQIVIISYLGMTAEFYVTVGSNTGKCGDNLDFSFDEVTGTLTITGSGAMYDYDYTGAPWSSYAADIQIVELPKTLTALGQNAFWCCFNMTSINLPDGITSIPDHALEECRALTSLTVPDSVKDIGQYAFSGAGLTELVLPEGLETIGNYAFMSCGSLKKIVLPESLKSLGGGAFYYCFKLETAELPETLDTISWYTFNECTSLQEITIPKSVTEISYYAFNSCTALNNVSFEGSAPSVDAGLSGADYPFQNVTSDAWYPGSDATWTNAAMQSMGGNLTWKQIGSTEEPAEPVVIASGTCGENLTWTLDDQGTLVISGSGAMDDYTSGKGNPWQSYYQQIRRIEIGDDVTTIGETAFLGFQNLTSVVIGKSVQSIGLLAFKFTGITSVVIPASVTLVKDGAFSSCEALKEIHFAGDAPVMEGDYIFHDVEAVAWYPANNSTWTEEARQNYSGRITWKNGLSCDKGHPFSENHICANCGLIGGTCGEGLDWTLVDGVLTISGSGAMDDYTSEGAPWYASDYRNSIETLVIGDGVTSIGSYAFEGCWNVKNEFSIPASVRTIGMYAFENGIQCASLTIPATVTAIGSHAFSNCEMKKVTIGSRTVASNAFAQCNLLETVTLEEGVTSIGYSSFFRCEKLSQVILPKTLTSIGANAFGYCSALESVILPERLNTLDMSAFINCTALKEIVIPASVTMMETAVFQNCTSLEKVTLPVGIKHIGGAAFEGCTALKTITIPAAVEQLYGEAFAFCTRLSEITFTGDAPSFYNDVFNGVLATAYYPAGNTTWTADVMQDYGGTITWKAYDGTETEDPTDPTVPEETTPEEPVTPTPEEPISATAKVSLTVRKEPDIYSTKVGSLDPGTQVMIYEITTVNGVEWARIDSGWVLLKQLDLNGGSEEIPAMGGTWGNNLTWEIDESGTLTISGTGEMLHYQDAVYTDNPMIDGYPWHLHKDKIISVVVEEGVTSLAEIAFHGLNNLSSVMLPDSLKTIGNAALAFCPVLKSIEIPGNVSSIGKDIFVDDTGLKQIVFMGDAPTFDSAAFSGVVSTAYYPADNTTWTSDVMQNYGGSITWVSLGNAENRLMLNGNAFSNLTEVWIDGVGYKVQDVGSMRFVDLPDSKAKTMTAYEYHVGDPGDVHTQYPVSMKVWTLENTDGIYTATRQWDFDNILQYSGMSIRVFGKKGVRMITSVQQAKKNALVSGGLAGYTLKEYGTAIAWADQLSGNKPLVLGKYYVKSNYAYRRGVADPVFNYTGDLMQYTNVLVNFSNEQCKNDIAMRPYMILQDENGQQITLYGGIIYRSIGYIAYQNRNVFEPGTDEYEYVWDIIHYVYGDLYDDDYKIVWSPPAM